MLRTSTGVGSARAGRGGADGAADLTRCPERDRKSAPAMAVPVMTPDRRLQLTAGRRDVEVRGMVELRVGAVEIKRRPALALRRGLIRLSRLPIATRRRKRAVGLQRHRPGIAQRLGMRLPKEHRATRQISTLRCAGAAACRL